MLIDWKQLCCFSQLSLCVQSQGYGRFCCLSVHFVSCQSIAAVTYPLGIIVKVMDGDNMDGLSKPDNVYFIWHVTWWSGFFIFPLISGQNLMMLMFSSSEAGLIISFCFKEPVTHHRIWVLLFKYSHLSAHVFPLVVLFWLGSMNSCYLQHC